MCLSVCVCVCVRARMCECLCVLGGGMGLNYFIKNSQFKKQQHLLNMLCINLKADSSYNTDRHPYSH